MDEWLSVEDLLKEAERIHKTEFPWHGKILIVPWVELKMDESPSFFGLLKGVDPTKMSDEEKMKIGERMTEDLTFAMINKAKGILNEPAWTAEQWSKFPLTLRKKIINEISGQQEESKQRF